MAAGTMRNLCRFYVRRAAPIGAFYSLVPTALWFAGVFALVPFREVYVLRLALALVVGSAVGALVNRVGVRLWVAKHLSPHGPGTVLDGALIGAACGWGAALIPPLTALIGSNHLETAKTFVIAAWLVAAANGTLLGALLAAVGRRHLDPGDVMGSAK